MERIMIHLPMSASQAAELRAGDLLLLSGALYTARDAAHKRLSQCLLDGLPPPIDLCGETIYYAGPCPARPGRIIGSAGPTTSGRMDAYAPLLLRHGLRVMIGKGERRPAVIEAMKEQGAVYLGATGGAGAVLAQCIRRAEVVAYPDLGTEAIRRLTVENFPVVVLIDSMGHNLYQTGRKAYKIDEAIQSD